MNSNTFRQSLTVIVFCLLFSVVINNIQAQVKLTEEEWVIPTYKIHPPDKNPIFFKGEVYQGASKYVYPYYLIDNLSNDKENKAWKALILENEYIKLCITPEIGGKLYYGTDKTNNYNFHYKNNVVKPANIGMLGAWVSGGTEWCVIHHHRASTYLPVDYDLVENKDGSKTIWIGETEPRHRMRWTIGITMFPGKSYYQTEVKIHNKTPLSHTFLYWANVAAHTNDKYQVIFPPSVGFVTYHAKNSFAHWPVTHEVYNGKDFTHGADISWWKNSPMNNSFFAHDLQEDFMGGYDHSIEAGTVHIGDHNIIKGAKLWEWGSGAKGQATEAKLTESDGPYVEIMVGAFSDNQPDYSWIMPYEVKSFKQYWYPVKDIQGFKNANLNGAVNLEKRGSDVFLGYYATEKIKNATILLKRNGETIFEKSTEISPEITFTTNLKIEGEFDITEFSTELINADNNELLLAYQPVNKQKPENLPETVKRPASPSEIKTTEELFLTGQRINQFYNPGLNAMDYFNEALKRDPSDIRTNVAVGKTLLEKGDYVNARIHFSRAIKRLTADYTRPSDCEALYLQGLTLKAMGLLEEAIDTLYRASWDYAYHSSAFLELSRISCINGDFEKALQQVDESLLTNAANNSGINLRSSILRRLGEFDAANQTLEIILNNDPLDFRACNERYLLSRHKSEKLNQDQSLLDVTTKMRDFDQNYLELAVEYLNDGLLEESEEILKRFNGGNQLVPYYLGFIADKKSDKNLAAEYFKKGSEQGVDYCFPFRLETIEVLNKALEYNEQDANAYYFLGNLLYDKQTQKAIECWEKAVSYNKNLAIAYRNLGWGYYRYQNDIPKAITAYEKALAINKSDPIYYSELDPLYEMANTSIEKRSELFKSSHETVSKRDDSFVREIMVLTLAGNSELAVKYLSSRFFGYREGSSAVRNITVDAHLMLGKKYLAENKFSDALDQFMKANILSDDGQDDSRSGDMRTPQIEYFIGLAYEAMGENEKANSSFESSVSKEISESGFIGYYQALSFQKLGENDKKEALLKLLIKNGDEQILKGSDVNFFAKFGEKERENQILSQAYLLKGLAYKGLGNKKESELNLKKSLELSNSNLWALTELKEKF